MNYEQWDQQTTELQNEHGHTCKPKPAGKLAKISVYEFINDWLPAQLAWHIFSYAAEPHAPKQVIADHYNGVGQRFYMPSGRQPGRWGIRWQEYGRLLKTSEQCVRLTAKFNRNFIVDFLTSVRKRQLINDKFPFGEPHLTRIRCPKKSVNVNKVKGRTKLIKNYTKTFKLDPDEEFALYSQFVANDGYTLSFTEHIAHKKNQHDDDRAAAAVAMCQAIQAI